MRLKIATSFHVTLIDSYTDKNIKAFNEYGVRS